MNARQLKQRRRELRLTQVELAALLHVDTMTVSRWERGRHKVKEAVALALRSLRPKKRKGTR